MHKPMWGSAVGSGKQKTGSWARICSLKVGFIMRFFYTAILMNSPSVTLARCLLSDRFIPNMPFVFFSYSFFEIKHVTATCEGPNPYLVRGTTYLIFSERTSNGVRLAYLKRCTLKNMTTLNIWLAIIWWLINRSYNYTENHSIHRSLLTFYVQVTKSIAQSISSHWNTKKFPADPHYTSMFLK